VPTYKAYRGISRDPLLFFDNRTSDSLFANRDEIAARERRLREGRPLTIAFSGRLAKIKGVEDLIDVCRHLKRQRFPFKLLIAGDGPLRIPIADCVMREQLDEVVMLGALDFHTELMPLMRQEVDIFVACHKQGDPSCTYLETLAAGVPIVGYSNEAFAGLLEVADVGWGAPLNEPEQIARTILSIGREQIIAKGNAALRFAKENSFNRTFARRIEHVLRIAKAGPRLP